MCHTVGYVSELKWSFSRKYPRYDIKWLCYEKSERERIFKFINHVPMSLKMWHLVVTKDWHLWLMCQLSCSFQHFVFSCQEIKRIKKSIYMGYQWIFKFSQTDYFFNLISRMKSNNLIKILILVSTKFSRTIFFMPGFIAIE